MLLGPNIKKEWREWKWAKDGIENMHTCAAPLLFLDGTEIFTHILQAVCSAITTDTTYNQPNDIDRQKEDRATKKEKERRVVRQ